jgi:hypothetical protein
MDATDAPIKLKLASRFIAKSKPIKKGDSMSHLFSIRHILEDIYQSYLPIAGFV